MAHYFNFSHAFNSGVEVMLQDVNLLTLNQSATLSLLYVLNSLTLVSLSLSLSVCLSLSLPLPLSLPPLSLSLSNFLSQIILA